MVGERAGLRRDLGDLAGEVAAVAEADLVGRDTQDGLLEDGERVVEVRGLRNSANCSRLLAPPHHSDL
jgi:hypothetical protein